MEGRIKNILFPPRDEDLSEEYDHQISLIRQRCGFTRQEVDLLNKTGQYGELERRNTAYYLTCLALEYGVRHEMTVMEYLRFIADTQLVINAIPSTNSDL